MCHLPLSRHPATMDSGVARSAGAAPPDHFGVGRMKTLGLMLISSAIRLGGDTTGYPWRRAAPGICFQGFGAARRVIWRPASTTSLRLPIRVSEAPPMRREQCLGAGGPQRAHGTVRHRSGARDKRDTGRVLVKCVRVSAIRFGNRRWVFRW